MTADEVRRIRRGLGLTQKQFGNLIGGVHRRTIRKWENGENLVNPMAAATIAVLGDKRSAAPALRALLDHYRRDMAALSPPE